MLDLIFAYGKECWRRRGELGSDIEVSIEISKSVAAIFARKMFDAQKQEDAPLQTYTHFICRGASSCH